MDNKTLTAKQMTQLGAYPRLNYAAKLGIISADIETEPGAKNKEYSVPMAFKWGFFAAFDGSYPIEVANEISAVAMATVHWILDNQNTGRRLWFVDFNGEHMFAGISYEDTSILQPEEKEDLCRFVLFDMYSWPDAEKEIWVQAKDNPWLLPALNPHGGAGTGLHTVLTQPLFRAKKTALYTNIRFYCVSDIFEKTAEAYIINPYNDVWRPLFVEFHALPEKFEVEKLSFPLK